MQNKSQDKKANIKAGLGSFAFRYAIGFDGFTPPRPMGSIEILEEAHRLGFGGVQLCENLKYTALGKEELNRVKEKADHLGLFIELGMNSISIENLMKHLDIAKVLSSKFLRIVLGSNGPTPEVSQDDLKAKAVDAIRRVLPWYREQGIAIGIENHFDLPAGKLVEIVEEINDPGVGLILDTTNGLGFVEKPEETLQLFKGHIVSVHLKDYIIKKTEAGYMMTGMTLGEGRLDARYILDEVVKENPNLSVIMEMTTRRQDNQSVEQVIVWEREVVKNSAERFFRYLGRTK